MSKRNNLHSFTLWPKASNHVHNCRRGKKSQMVSKAIEWYNKPREFIIREHEYHSKMDDEVKTYTRKIRLIDLSDLVEANDQLQKRYAEAMIRIADLEKPQSFIYKIRNLFKK